LQRLGSQQQQQRRRAGRRTRTCASIGSGCGREEGDVLLVELGVLLGQERKDAEELVLGQGVEQTYLVLLFIVRLIRAELLLEPPDRLLGCFILN
jgi:hypothetical protein